MYNKVKYITDEYAGISSAIIARKLILVIGGFKEAVYNINKNKDDEFNITWEQSIKSQKKFIDNLIIVANTIKITKLKDDQVIEFIKILTKDAFERLINIFNEEIDTLEIRFSYSCAKALSRERGSKEIDNSYINSFYKLIECSPNSTIIDPFCKDGLLLTNGYFNYEDINIKYHGVAALNNDYESAILIDNLVTEFNPQGKFYNENSIENPLTDEKGNLSTFDYVISELPYGDFVDEEIIENDKFNRFKFSRAAKCKNIEWAAIEHILSIFKKKAIIFIPIGFLYRNGKDKEMRKLLIEEDIIEKVIKLPEEATKYSETNICALVLNKNRNKSKEIEFLNINAIEFTGYEYYSEMIDELLNWNYEDEEFNERYSSYPIEVIREKDYDLNAFEYKNMKNGIYNCTVENVALKNIADIKSGLQLSKSAIDELTRGNKEDKVSKTHKLVGIKELVDGKVDLSNVRSKIVPKERWVREYSLKYGDILVTAKGSKIKVAMAYEIENAIYTSNIYRIRVKEGMYNAKALLAILSSEYGENILRSIAKGSTVKSIRYADIENMLIPMIENEYQNILVDRLERAEDKLHEAEAEYSVEEKAFLREMGINPMQDRIEEE